MLISECWSIEKSGTDSIKEFSGSDTSKVADSDATSVVDEPTTNGEYIEVSGAKKGKGKQKDKGSMRALIELERAISKKDTSDDIVMENSEDDLAGKRKQALSKSMQVMCSSIQTIISSGSDSSASVAIVKKSKLATGIPSGLLKGYVPVATRSRSSSAVITVANSHGNTIDSDTDFKMGGFENLDEDGNEVADKKYPKYTAIRASDKRGFQVRDSNLEYSCMMVDLCFYRPWLTSI